jgi:hypothetical protein
MWQAAAWQEQRQALRCQQRWGSTCLSHSTEMIMAQRARQYVHSRHHMYLQRMRLKAPME